MPLDIPNGVKHVLRRFNDGRTREFELAVVRSEPTQLMGCNSFLDFGVGSVGDDVQDLFRLQAEDLSGCTHYRAELSPKVTPLFLSQTVWPAVYQALMNAQRTRVDGMWINGSDNVTALFELNGPGEPSMLFEGMVEGVRAYWADVCRKPPEHHVGSVIIGAGAEMFNALGKPSKIASMLTPYMTVGGLLRLV